MKRLLIAMLCGSLALPAAALELFGGSGDRVLQVLYVAEGQTSAGGLPLSKTEELEGALLFGGRIAVSADSIVPVLEKRKDVPVITGPVFCEDPEGGKTGKLECVNSFSFVINAVGSFGWRLHKLSERSSQASVFVKPFE